MMAAVMAATVQGQTYPIKEFDPDASHNETNGQRVRVSQTETVTVFGSTANDFYWNVLS